jgi:DNA-binding response OmpR family regulator
MRVVSLEFTCRMHAMPKKRIVIVEDERDMADLLATRLRREGYKVDVAEDGVAGLNLVRSEPLPDLALLDIMLPGISGIEIAAKLRDDPRTAGVPIIMLTARSEESDIVVGLKFGADDYMTKPFSMAVLMARIDALLRRNRLPSTPGKTARKAGPLLIDHQRYSVELEGRALTVTLMERMRSDPQPVDGTNNGPGCRRRRPKHRRSCGNAAA